MASLGLPGLAGFWGEMLTMFGAFDPARGLSRPAFLTFMSVAAFGTLLTAGYLLLVVRRVCMGGAPQEQLQGPERRADGESGAETPQGGATPVGGIQDVRTYEVMTWTPLVALTVLAGLWPAVLLGLTDPAVQKLLAGGKA